MSRVALIYCENYDSEKVYSAIKRGIELLGGISQFIKPNEQLLLKPNMLSAKTPDKHATTHPAIMEGFIRLLQEHSYNNIVYGDSPVMDSPEKAARVTGLQAVADKYDIQLVNFRTGSTVSYPEGKQCMRFEIAEGVQNADAIINLCKMKTHQLTRITGAIKNQLGCVYGFNKAGKHASFPSAVDFSKMLIDLNLLLKPRLHIMDGIIAMEGNGPGSGDPTPMKALLISDDPVAIDATFCRLIDLDPQFVPAITFGQEMGLGTYKAEEIELLGDKIEILINPDFNVVRMPVKSELPNIITSARNILLRRPVIIANECIKCGKCVEACPVAEKAINFESSNHLKPPKYNYKKCIRCYCCQETCPAEAIKVKTPLLGRMFLYR